MKKTAGLFIVFGFVLATPALKAHAQKPFEGTFRWAMTMPSEDSDTHSVIMNIKGDKSETDMDMGAQGIMKFYRDQTSKKIYIAMPAVNMGIVEDIPDSTPAGVNSDPLDLNPTGNEATIAGYHAKEYILKGLEKPTQDNINKDSIWVTLWVTPDLPKDIQESFFNSLNNSQGQDINETKAMKLFVGKGLVPIRIVVASAGETDVSMEFVKYERKSLDDSVFVPPANIKYDTIPKHTGGGMN